MWNTKRPSGKSFGVFYHIFKELSMEAHEIKDLLTKHKEESHKILQQNNVLLHAIIKQNHLIFTITQNNIRGWSSWWLWSQKWESYETKKLRRELEALYKQIIE